MRSPFIPRAALLGALSSILCGCRASSHPVQPAELGTVRSSDELIAVLDQPSPILFETVMSTEWKTVRSGLINLDDPKAQAAGLVDGDEPIQIYFHAFRHPERGLFIVDTGVEVALRDDPKHSAVQGLVSFFVNPKDMKFGTPLGPWLLAQGQPLAGVMLTHLHVDHVSGVPDVPPGTPLYAGPGETNDSKFLNFAVQYTIDRQLKGQAPIREWQYQPDSAGRFAGVIDVFGDKTVWALYVPGHTAGSTAYLVRTNQGPVLITGDACHTRWGWDNGVEPGSFSSDRPKSRESLAQLERLVAEHPNIQVRLGHQP